MADEQRADRRAPATSRAAQSRDPGPSDRSATALAVQRQRPQRRVPAVAVLGVWTSTSSVLVARQAGHAGALAVGVQQRWTAHRPGRRRPGSRSSSDPPITAKPAPRASPALYAGRHVRGAGRARRGRRRERFCDPAAELVAPSSSNHQIHSARSGRAPRRGCPRAGPSPGDACRPCGPRRTAPSSPWRWSRTGAARVVPRPAGSAPWPPGTAVATLDRPLVLPGPRSARPTRRRRPARVPAGPADASDFGQSGPTLQRSGPGSVAAPGTRTTVQMELGVRKGGGSMRRAGSLDGGRQSARRG